MKNLKNKKYKEVIDLLLNVWFIILDPIKIKKDGALAQWPIPTWCSAWQGAKVALWGFGIDPLCVLMLITTTNMNSLFLFLLFCFLLVSGLPQDPYAKEEFEYQKKPAQVILNLWPPPLICIAIGIEKCPLLLFPEDENPFGSFFRLLCWHKVGVKCEEVLSGVHADGANGTVWAGTNRALQHWWRYQQSADTRDDFTEQAVRAGHVAPRKSPKANWSKAAHRLATSASLLSLNPKIQDCAQSRPCIDSVFFHLLCWGIHLSVEELVNMESDRLALLEHRLNRLKQKLMKQKNDLTLFLKMNGT